MSRLYLQFYVRPRLVLGLPVDVYVYVSAAMHVTLHWLSFPQRVTFNYYVC